MGGSGSVSGHVQKARLARSSWRYRMLAEHVPACKVHFDRDRGPSSASGAGFTRGEMKHRSPRQPTTDNGSIGNARALHTLAIAQAEQVHTPGKAIQRNTYQSLVVDHGAGKNPAGEVHHIQNAARREAVLQE